jgi:beta-mannosidase
MGGKLLGESKKAVDGAALSSTNIGEFSDAELLHGARPGNTVASFDVIENGNVIAHHLLYFGVAKALALPRQPGLTAKWRDDGKTLRISAKQMARGIWIDFGKLDADLSNNAFDLLPGEQVDITVNSKADPASLKTALKLTSLVDTVQPEAAK